jgi:small redox-active disulfide protein 2
MKNIQILGTGCPKCKALAAVTEQAAQSIGVEYTLEKVTNINDISAFGVMFTPALVIDGEVKLAGKVPSVEEVKKLLA